MFPLGVNGRSPKETRLTVALSGKVPAYLYRLLWPDIVLGSGLTTGTEQLSLGLNAAYALV